MNIIKPLFQISGMTLISRIFGFLRDILIAACFGAGGIADAFFVAIKFPNIFRRILAEGALNISFVPMFTKKNDNRDTAKKFYREIFNFLFWSLILVVSIFELLMPSLIYLFAPGFMDSDEKFNLVLDLARISFPYLFFISLTSLLCGVLNSLEKYTLAASLPILVNLFMILALFFIFNNGISDTEGAAKILMSSFLVSGLAQLLICIYACQRLGYLPSIHYPKISKNIKDFFKLSFPAMGAGGITQINILVGTIIASFENKAVSYLYYADRIYQLPLALIGISIGIVLLPNLSKEIKKNNSQLIQEIQNKSLELSLILAIPASIGLIYLSNDIIMVLFERYLFDTTDTIATSRVLMIFALGLPAFVCIKILQILYFARENTSLPMRFALISVITNIILSIILFQYIGYMGIAIATTLSSWLNAILLFRKSIKENFLKISASLPKKIFKVIIVSILMIAFLFTIESYILDINYSFTGIVNFLILLFYIITGIMFYFIVCSKMAIIKIQDFFNDNKMS